MTSRLGRAARRIPGGGAAFFCALALRALLAAAQENPAYPLILSLEGRAGDAVFKQYQEDVERGRRLVFNRRGRESDAALAEQLGLYRYETRADDALFAGIPAREQLQRLAARCSVPYSSIASLNNLDAGSPPRGLLLLPSIPGLFIREDAPGDFERMLLAARPGEGALISIEAGGVKKSYRFIPGADFSPSERALFLNPALFRFPLRAFTVSSAFGRRVSPVSGKPMLHQGLDFAAPLGADVYAVREGTVTFAGENAVFGNYVVISHDEGWVSLYGHLSSIETALRKKVQPGTIIGKVGSTGLSTGPHLHFELRKNGTSQDPSAFLRKR